MSHQQFVLQLFVAMAKGCGCRDGSVARLLHHSTLTTHCDILCRYLYPPEYDHLVPHSSNEQIKFRTGFTGLNFILTLAFHSGGPFSFPLELHRFLHLCFCLKCFTNFQPDCHGTLLNSRCQHANMVKQDVNMVNIIPP